MFLNEKVLKEKIKANSINLIQTIAQYFARFTKENCLIRALYRLAEV
jgi:hypothetical protein